MKSQHFPVKKSHELCIDLPSQTDFPVVMLLTEVADVRADPLKQ